MSELFCQALLVLVGDRLCTVGFSGRKEVEEWSLASA
jgi:hypothetical protein